MEKYVVLVDAGYVYAEGSKLMFGDMKPIYINGSEFCSSIYDKIEEFYVNELQEPIPRRLRMYWYDARERSQWIASMPGVTLRLGRVNYSGTQKGVDGAIIRDMLTLCDTGKVSDVFLISGDEDLIEGVSKVKDQGVLVHLFQFKTVVNNMSHALLNEADGLLEIHQTDMRTAITGPGDIIDMETQAPARKFLNDELQEELQWISSDFLARYSADELMTMKPRIPQAIDKMLFKRIENADSPTEVEDARRHEIRGAFWEFVATLVS